jgi:hypothetical protein
MWVIELDGSMACGVLVGADGACEEVSCCLLLSTLGPRVAERAVLRDERLAHQYDPEKLIR